MSSIPWIARVETIKWQIRAAYGRLVAGQIIPVNASPTSHRLYTRFVCDTESATAAAVCGWWRYISVICLCLFLSYPAPPIFDPAFFALS